MRSACIRHREISREKFDSSSDFDTFPLQVGCYYFCCTGVKRVGGGAMQVADLSQTNRTDIMNDDERWMGSDTSGTTLLLVYKNKANFQLEHESLYDRRVRGSSGFDDGLGCTNYFELMTFVRSSALHIDFILCYFDLLNSRPFSWLISGQVICAATKR